MTSSVESNDSTAIVSNINKFINQDNKTGTRSLKELLEVSEEPLTMEKLATHIKTVKESGSRQDKEAANRVARAVIGSTEFGYLSRDKRSKYGLMMGQNLSIITELYRMARNAGLFGKKSEEVQTFISQLLEQAQPPLSCIEFQKKVKGKMEEEPNKVTELDNILTLLWNSSTTKSLWVKAIAQKAYIALKGGEDEDQNSYFCPNKKDFLHTVKNETSQESLPEELQKEFLKIWEGKLLSTCENLARTSTKEYQEALDDVKSTCTQLGLSFEETTTFVSTHTSKLQEAWAKAKAEAEAEAKKYMRSHKEQIEQQIKDPENAKLSFNEFLDKMMKDLPLKTTDKISQLGISAVANLLKFPFYAKKICDEEADSPLRPTWETVLQRIQYLGQNVCKIPVTEAMLKEIEKYWNTIPQKPTSQQKNNTMSDSSSTLTGPSPKKPNPSQPPTSLNNIVEQQAENLFTQDKTISFESFSSRIKERAKRYVSFEENQITPLIQSEWDKLNPKKN